jgi:hypothetical protein
VKKYWHFRVHLKREFTLESNLCISVRGNIKRKGEVLEESNVFARVSFPPERYSSFKIESSVSVQQLVYCPNLQEFNSTVSSLKIKFHV